MGTKDLSKAQPWFIANKFDEEKQEGVIKVNKEYVEELSAALTLVDSLDSSEAFITVEKISGSISNL
jgi:RNase P/RNase MRP subunit POP5